MTLIDHIKALREQRDPDQWEEAVEAILMTLALEIAAVRASEDLV